MIISFGYDEYYVPTFDRGGAGNSHCIEVPDNVVKKWERAEKKMQEAWDEMREYMEKAKEERKGVR